MQSRAPLTLTALKRHGGLHSWPEAVAVVLEVSDRIVEAGEALVTPDADHIAFDEGRLIILPGAPIPPHPVRQAAKLLSELLRGIPAPAELRELIAENMQEPPSCAWIEEFMTALAYFDRPRRPQIVNTLAVRAHLAQQTNSPGDVASDASVTLAGPEHGGLPAAVSSRPTPSVIARVVRRLLGRNGTP